MINFNYKRPSLSTHNPPLSTLNFPLSLLNSPLNIVERPGFHTQILVDGKPVKLGLMWYWSSDAFKERFEQYNQIRRGTRVAVVIYRIYMSLDLEEIKRYMDDIVNRSSDKEIPKVLVGYSRGDIEDRREISREEGEAIAREYSCPFFEVSLAKEEDIENLLVTIWRMAHEYDLLKSPPPPQSQDPPPAPPPEPKKNKPCDVQ